jgi:hypothetical protein
MPAGSHIIVKQQPIQRSILLGVCTHPPTTIGNSIMLLPPPPPCKTTSVPNQTREDRLIPCPLCELGAQGPQRRTRCPNISLTNASMHKSGRSEHLPRWRAVGRQARRVRQAGLPPAWRCLASAQQYIGHALAPHQHQHLLSVQRFSSSCAKPHNTDTSGSTNSCCTPSAVDLSVPHTYTHTYTQALLARPSLQPCLAVQ